jgi:hypothetical protein
MQRVRMSLPHFREFGWEPYVLSVADNGAAPVEPLLLMTIPEDVSVERVMAVPPHVARLAGVGNVALRAMPWLHRAGARTIAANSIDLVYFSTTMFLSMPLGRIWHRRFGTPYILDIQDPWLSDYYEQHPDAAPPPKYGLARRLHALLEPWTMRNVGGVIAVSPEYIATLRRRYPWLRESVCATIPFAAAQADFDLLSTHPQPNRAFRRRQGTINAAYVGRGGDDMRPALRVLFRAMKAGLAANRTALEGVRATFVGTDYAPPERARKTVEPIAREIGVGDQVVEQTTRVPYFEALQIMSDADVLILIGSDDAGYSPSKIYPYLLSRKPIIAIVHDRSSLIPLLENTSALTVTFSEANEAQAAARLALELPAFLGRLPPTSLAPELERACSAREMTRRQCQLFDQVATRAIAA